VRTYYYVISKSANMKYLIQDLGNISKGLPHEKNILVGFFNIKSAFSEKCAAGFQTNLSIYNTTDNLFCCSNENLPILHIWTQVLPVFILQKNSKATLCRLCLQEIMKWLRSRLNFTPTHASWALYTMGNHTALLLTPCLGPNRFFNANILNINTGFLTDFISVQKWIKVHPAKVFKNMSFFHCFSCY
jgi:hypothetical protein